MADGTRKSWAKTHDFTPNWPEHSELHPESFARLRALVTEASNAGRHVRAAGSFWSFNDGPACTDVSIGPAAGKHKDPPSYKPPSGLKLIEVTKGPSYDGALGAALEASLKQGGRSFVRVGALVSVGEALAALAKEDLGFIAMGSRAGQRVVGACMTSSHAGDFDLPPMVDFVRAIQLVTFGGRELWIERASARLTKGASPPALEGVGADAALHADDDLFDAALVSVGSLGVVASLVFETRGMYGLSERSRWMPWLDVRAKLLDGTIFTDVAGLTDPAKPHPSGGSGAAPLRADGYRHVEILINPYPDPHGVRHALVATRVEHPSWSTDDYARAKIDIDEVGLFAAVESGNPARYYETLRDLITMGREDTPAVHRYQSVQDTKNYESQPVYSSELVVTTSGNAHVAALDDMLAQIDRLRRDTPYEYSGFISARFTRSSRAALAMQSSSDPHERFCHVEVFALQEIFWGVAKPHELEGRNEDYVGAMFGASERRGGRAHWGQWAHPDHPLTIEAYPRREVFLAAKRKLAEHGPLTTFDSRYAIGAGLTPLGAARLLADGFLPSRRTSAPFDTRAIREHAPGVHLAADRLWVAATSGDGVPSLSRASGVRSLPFETLSLEGASHVASAFEIVANHDGRIELVGRLGDGRIVHAWARRGRDEWMTTLQAFDGAQRFASSPATLLDGTGRLTLFAIDTRGVLAWRRQSSPGGTWKGWSDVGGAPKLVGDLAALWADGLVLAGRDPSGKIVLGSQASAALDAPFVFHTMSEAADGTPSLAWTPTGLVVVYFQGGVLRAFAALPAGLRGTAPLALTPLSNPGASRPLVPSRPGVLVSGAAVVVAYPSTSGALAANRLELASGAWANEKRIDARFVSAVHLELRRSKVLAFGKLAHDMVGYAEL